MFAFLDNLHEAVKRDLEYLQHGAACLCDDGDQWVQPSFFLITV